MGKNDLGGTSTGIQANVAGLLSYVLGWISGLIFILIEKENKFVRFHAMQSIILFGGLSVLQVIVGVLNGILFAIHLAVLVPVITLLNGLLMLAGFILWIVLMVKSHQGEKFKLPVVGDIAEKNS